MRLELLSLSPNLALAANDELHRNPAGNRRPYLQGSDCKGLQFFQGLEHKMYMNYQL